MPVDYSAVEELLGLTATKIQKQIPDLNDTFKLFRKDADVAMAGGKIIAPVISNLGHAAGPKPIHDVTTPQFPVAKFEFGQGYCTTELEKKTMEILKRDPLNVLGDLKILLDLAEDELYRYLATMMWSEDGRLAEVDGVSGNDITILPCYANQTLYPKDAMKYFRLNQWVDIVRAGVVIVDGAVVEAMDEDNRTLTLDDASGTQVGDYVYWYGTIDSPPPPGFPAMINNTGSYGEINRATAGNEWWHSVVKSKVGGQDLTRRLINSVFYGCGKKMGRKQWIPDSMITTSEVCEEWADLLTFTVNANAGAGQQAPLADVGVGGYGYTNPFNGKRTNMTIDELCPQGTMWILTKAKLYLKLAADFEWIKTGLPGIMGWFHYMGIIKTENDIYRAMGSLNYNPFTNHCSNHGVIKDINTTVISA